HSNPRIPSESCVATARDVSPSFAMLPSHPAPPTSSATSGVTTILRSILQPLSPSRKVRRCRDLHCAAMQDGVADGSETSLHGHVAPIAPSVDRRDVSRAWDDIPVRLGGSPHREVGQTVAVVVARNRRVGENAPLLHDDAAIAAADDVPVAL